MRGEGNLFDGGLNGRWFIVDRINIQSLSSQASDVIYVIASSPQNDYKSHSCIPEATEL